jgi:hypothetical protein
VLPCGCVLEQQLHKIYGDVFEPVDPFAASTEERIRIDQLTVRTIDDVPITEQQTPTPT